jgi:hypothetical protein
VKHFDSLPVNVFRVGQRVEKIQLRRSRCDDDTRASAIKDSTTHCGGRLFGGGFAQSVLVFENSNNHAVISSVVTDIQESRTTFMERVFISQPLVLTMDLISIVMD